MVLVLNSSLSALTRCRQPILRRTDVSTTPVLSTCLKWLLRAAVPLFMSLTFILLRFLFYW